MRKQTQKFASEQTLGRQFGLGRNIQQGMSSQQIDALAAQSLTCGFTQVPVIEYVTWTVELPVLDTNIESTFSDEIDVLTNPKAVPGVTIVDSSFAINGLLQVDMVVIGFGVHVFAEPESGTILGNAISPVPVAGAVPVSPDAYTVNDTTNGALGPTLKANGGSTISPAELEWGAPAWNAAWHCLNAYQFNWIVQQRYAVIQELAADVAYFGPYAEAAASGTSQEASQRFARRANDTYASLGYTGAFVPVNAQRIGSISTLAPASGSNLGLFHPTRAYDEVSMTWGGIRGQGGTGCCQPFRKLPRAMLLEKGIPVNMKLVAQDAYHQKEMQRYLSISDGYGGVNALVQFASGSGGLTVANADAFLELTLDATPVAVAQQVQTDRTLMKGGAFKLAILVKGFEVWGAWRGYMANLLANGNLTSPGAQ